MTRFHFGTAWEADYLLSQGVTHNDSTDIYFSDRDSSC